MSRADRMEQSLRSAFSPQHLEIVDESEAHRGHGGWREEGETHYRVEITSSAFNGQSRVARQRAVNQALAAEFDAGLHALSLSVEGTE
ncbi:MAG: BolA family protein [Pseudomonadota bacterium]